VEDSETGVDSVKEIVEIHPKNPFAGDSRVSGAGEENYSGKKEAGEGEIPPLMPGVLGHFGPVHGDAPLSIQ